MSCKILISYLQETYSLKESCNKCAARKIFARNVMTCKNLTKIDLSCKILAKYVFRRMLQDSCKKGIVSQLGIFGPSIGFRDR